MLAVSLGLLLVGSGVGVHIEDRVELALPEAETVARALASAIEARTEALAVVDDPLAPECRSETRCVEAIRARTKTDDLVLIRLFAGPTKIRLIAERLALESARNARIELNLPREEGERDPVLEEVARTLFPEGARGSTREVIAVSTTRVDEGVAALDVLPWVSFGLSAASFAVAAVFGASSQSARNALLDDSLVGAEFNDTFDRMQTHNTVAYSLALTGAATLVLGVVFLLFQ